LESRKYQLQKQIIEALKANDNDLYSLLKSQWAHRFGVESLEELKNLDLSQLNQNPSNLSNQKIDQPQENSFEGNKEIILEDDDNKGKGIESKKFESPKDDNDEAFKIKSYEIVNKESIGSKATNSFKEINQNEIEALIPLPPKPKYSYLKKWLLRK
jgi:hypothetical protein